MKHTKKLVSCILAASMTVSLMPAVSFAAPARPFINGLSTGYKGGIDAIQ